MCTYVYVKRVSQSVVALALFLDAGVFGVCLYGFWCAVPLLATVPGLMAVDGVRGCEAAISSTTNLIQLRRPHLGSTRYVAARDHIVWGRECTKKERKRNSAWPEGRGNLPESMAAPHHD